MTEHIQTAKRLVAALELQLRDLISKAAAAGRYDNVSTLTSLVTKVSDLVGTISNGNHLGAAAEEASHDRLGEKGAQDSRSGQRRRVQSRASEYPQFCRDGDALVKVGWSKSARSEYQHRVGKAGIDALVRFLATRRSNQFPLSVDEMAKALEGDPSGILGYQVYVVVAWLREAGVLTANGRHGYTMLKVKGFSVESRIEELWTALPAHT